MTKDESMVMLRRELCWSYKDVASLKLLNAQPGRKSKLTEESKRALKRLFWPDYMLYDHFHAKFKARVASQLGKKELQTELAVFQEEKCGSQKTLREVTLCLKKSCRPYQRSTEQEILKVV